MKLKTISMVVIVLISMFLTVGLVPAEVSAESGTDTIQEDYHKAHTVSFDMGDSIKVSYKMEVTDGPYIDVYLLDSDNYRYYKDGQEFSYIMAGTDINTKYSSNTVTLNKHDTYYIVFDNTDVGTDPPWNMIDDTAYVDWTIDSEVNYIDLGFGDNSNNLLCFSFAIIGIIIIVVVIVIYFSKKKKQPSTQTPPQHYPTPYQPSQPPLQPPPRQHQQYPPYPPKYPQQPLPPQPLPQQQLSKFCPNCGKKTEGKMFCSECGEKL